MKNIVTGTDMKKVDSYTINTIGIPSLVLMGKGCTECGRDCLQKPVKG